MQSDATMCCFMMRSPHLKLKALDRNQMALH